MSDRYRLKYDSKEKLWGVWDNNKNEFAFGVAKLSDLQKGRQARRVVDMNREWERIKREGK